ncbi:MAG TPA: multicopper oxidase domain-containing protein [Actinomycetes bacterium]|jgi:FtsP/CotA-like multicopper oxidase with cupredoxin domain|nr:multicopper oxidase domain-containing protein [Actinomycetes bacterium]
MGRFGNVFLVGGEPDLSLAARAGEVVRLWLTNTANTRVFNVRLPGARMKLVGGDSGRVEHEEFVSEVLLAPSERAVVDVLVEQPGELTLQHRTPNRTYPLARITVREERATPSLAGQFELLRHAPELQAERQGLDAWLAAPPDKVLALVAQMDDPAGPQPGGGPVGYVCPMHPEVTGDMPGRCLKCGMKLLAAQPVTEATPTDDMTAMEHDAGHADDHDHGAHDQHAQGHDHAHGAADGIEWEDDMVEVNRQTTTATMHWKFLDRTSGAYRDADPIQALGERWTRDGITEPNLVWKDTVLVRTGQTVDILFDVTNPGLWMAHCHIAEHMQSGMMFSFNVTRTQQT